MPSDPTRIAASSDRMSPKVFSATMVADRDQLGEKVTAWMANHPQLKVTDVVVTQSSDEAFHCIAITVFFWEENRR